ncbi:hypothetical protein [Robertmurraya kyonggiensis]|uniref:Uncharacterized protein n=1 Tax=Robertmurraya kyonggiensis TaxID=1037680 RepID=A0A4U1D6D0_9BACI|nr:hypothetical protein [Robertmurraya kyonggiensis]TKC18179.1 hypothetical protein FA727_01075 [Robertmurraya kyonggiensis]
MKQVKELFTESKKVIEEYKSKVEELDQQERELQADLETIQQELTDNLLEQETATISEVVYLKIRKREIVSRSEVINVLLEELNEERTALKLQYTPILKDVLVQDRKALNEYNATEIVEKYRYMMLSEIAEMGKAVNSQFHSIAPDVMEIFDDKTVKERYPNIYHAFNQEQYKPSLQWANDTVVTKNDIFLANGGRLPQGLKQPKDVK